MYLFVFYRQLNETESKFFKNSIPMNHLELKHKLA